MGNTSNALLRKRDPEKTPLGHGTTFSDASGAFEVVEKLVIRIREVYRTACNRNLCGRA